MKSSSGLEVVVLIERALNGTLKIDEATHFFSRLGKDANRIVSEAAHAVVHFLTDADIRQRDKEYDLLLRIELEKYAQQLKERPLSSGKVPEKKCP